MVNAAVIKNPKGIVEDLFQMAAGDDSNFSRELSKFESKAGVNVIDDMAAPLGGEVAMAFDGPMLPTPRWKVVFEVYDPATLQSTVGKLVEAFNRQASPADGSLQLTSQQTGSQTYYTLRNPKQPSFEIDYAYVDSYVIAAPDIATLSLAIRDRRSGNTLTHSQSFQALLPSDGYTNFSAIFYHNIGPVVGPLVQQIKAVGTLTPQQQKSIATLQANTAPGLIYVYGEPNRIVVASDTGFMGFDLGTLLTMGQGGAFLPQMFLRDGLSRPVSTQ